ncbi:MAG TPA: NAD(P)H-binding protein [Pseudonocardiaceae bacterium]|nr:NAD(P)H-binding protein [Pseudonocardiaceae bacterium]
MITVTGATGNVGRALVERLAKSGEKVTAVSRGIGAGDVPAGVRFERADLAEPESLKPALAGADSVFVLVSGAVASIDGVVEQAKAAGVRRVVLVSSQGVATGRYPADHEDAVTGSGLEWTILRPGGFDSNTLQWAGMVRERRVAAPFGDVGLPTVDPLDIAEVAAAVLREPGHQGQVYTLTGPALISPREQAAAIADALGEEVRFSELSREDAKARMAGIMPEWVAEVTLDILGDPTPAELAVSPDVQRVLGRAARSYREWVGRNVAAFR